MGWRIFSSCLLTASPSPCFRLRKTMVEIMVRMPSAMRALWMPWIISVEAVGPLTWPVGTKKAVARPAVATPKLMDICCMVLAMLLAALDCC